MKSAVKNNPPFKGGLRGIIKIFLFLPFSQFPDGNCRASGLGSWADHRRMAVLGMVSFLMINNAKETRTQKCSCFLDIYLFPCYTTSKTERTKKCSCYLSRIFDEKLKLKEVHFV